MEKGKWNGKPDYYPQDMEEQHPKDDFIYHILREGCSQSCESIFYKWKQKLLHLCIFRKQMNSVTSKSFDEIVGEKDKVMLGHNPRLRAMTKSIKHRLEKSTT